MNILYNTVSYTIVSYTIPDGQLSEQKKHLGGNCTFTEEIKLRKVKAHDRLHHDQEYSAGHRFRNYKCF